MRTTNEPPRVHSSLLAQALSSSCASSLPRFIYSGFEWMAARIRGNADRGNGLARLKGVARLEIEGSFCSIHSPSHHMFVHEKHRNRCDNVLPSQHRNQPKLRLALFGIQQYIRLYMYIYTMTTDNNLCRWRTIQEAQQAVLPVYSLSTTIDSKNMKNKL